MVSIPQSEFCPLGRSRAHLGNARRDAVSIPQSEFCPLGHLPVLAKRLESNPVSIPQSEFCPLGLAGKIVVRPGGVEFQFLSRNSVRWDHGRGRRSYGELQRFNSSVGILSVGTYFGPRRRI